MKRSRFASVGILGPRLAMSGIYRTPHHLVSIEPFPGEARRDALQEGGEWLQTKAISSRVRRSRRRNHG